jgi:regulatory protein
MKTRIQPSARNKIMDYLAQRDHSEKELRDKLARRYSPEEISEAIEGVRASGLLREPEELAKAVAAQLARKKKSYRYIQEFLKKKGLPAVQKTGEEELEKARELLLLKFRKGPPFSYEEKPKVQRYLMYRGFDHETIRKVMNERQ